MRALCLYIDAGKGHYIPAKAVKEELDDMGIETRILPFFDYVDIKWIGRANQALWRLMLKMPSAERHIVKLLDERKLPMRFLTKHCIKKRREYARKLIEEFRPDFVFTTHPYPGTIFSAILDSLGEKIPVYYYATDVFMTPTASICPLLRKLLVCTEEGRESAISKGMDEEKVMVVPFPVQRSLYKMEKLTKKEAKRKLGLDENLFTMQLNLGGEGLGSLGLLETLLRADRPMQIVILGGINERMRKRIDLAISLSQARNTKVHTPGFVDNVGEYLMASDIVAGRAGINTIVEAIYAHRPFLITDFVYSVTPSVAYVVKHNVGWDACHGEDPAKIVLSLLDDPSLLDRFEEAYDEVPITYGADKLARILVSDSEECRRSL